MQVKGQLHFQSTMLREGFHYCTFALHITNKPKLSILYCNNYIENKFYSNFYYLRNTKNSSLDRKNKK